jgi:sugar (pentulose or hexulose) kinase
LLAGTAVGVYASLEEAVACAVAPDRQFEPALYRAAHYQDRWTVYQQVAAALRPLNPLL